MEYVTGGVANLSLMDSKNKALAVLNESVTLISSFDENGRIEISILGKVGVEEYWVKPFTVGLGPVTDLCYAMGMDNKCDVISFIRNGSSELASFDVITGKVIHNIGFESKVITQFNSTLVIGQSCMSLLAVGNSLSYTYTLSL
ncbi:hypothetical protein S83_040327 [Arachis hypogaea]